MGQKPVLRQIKNRHKTTLKAGVKIVTTYTLGKTIITKEPDNNPDTSYLGEYGSTLKEGCILCKDKTFFEDITDDMTTSDIREKYYINGEYPYFYPPDNGEKPGTPDYKKYALQDYKIMEDLNNSQWTYVGITVKTVIYTDMGISDHVQDSLRGIEDHWDKDSDDYFTNDIIPDLKDEVKAQLLEMGFTDEEIDQSLNNPVMEGF